MPNTLIPIQTITLSSSASVVGFYNIPQNYTDLKVIISTRNVANSVAGNVYVKPNGSSSNMATRNYYGYATGGGSNTDTYCWGYCNANLSTASTFSNLEFTILSYTSSTNKTLYCDSVFENNGSEARLAYNNGLWSNTSPITSLEFITRDNGGTGADSTFVANSTFTLYGISNGVKATGGTLTVAGGYAYHTFTSTGSFLPSQQINNAEVLVIAGGASGGCASPSGVAGGGGGAGGYVYSSNQLLKAGTSYTAIVGAGGAGRTYNVSGHQRGLSGSDSIFPGITSAIGGGGGGVYPNDSTRTALSGGSGGGGGADSGTGYTGAAGTIGQGNSGGNGWNGGGTGSNGNAGGGGGAGAVGTNGIANNAGVGGAGLYTHSIWASATGTGVDGYYAGGGGGGTTYGSGFIGAGGVGGGGLGGYSQSSGNGTPGSGTANTGSGGGGSAALNGSVGGTNSGSGGSGIIIIRYPLT